MKATKRAKIRLQVLTVLDNGNGWARDGREWLDDEDSPIILWTGEGTTINDMPAFNNYSYESDPREEIWTNGVHNDLVELADKLGAYWECYDSGTYMLYMI
tara:strand:+ start:602 stop:904 length:303 start_codon:yes stop_codon:yes gene_type:complete